MRVGILGVGHIGATLARKLSGAGHDVKVANSREPQTIPPHVLTTGVRAVSAPAAVADVDAVIVSIPLYRIPAIAPRFSDLPDAVVVIDTSNYYPDRDNTIEAIEAGQTESLWVADQLGRAVVKAWNSIDSRSFATLGKPPGTPDRIAIPVSGETVRDRGVGMELVEQTGFDAFDAGVLADSWRQQPGTPCYCTNLTRLEMASALAAADPTRSPKRRDLAVAAIQERFAGGVTNPEAEYVVRLNRALFT